MFQSRPITTEASRLRALYPMRQYSTDGQFIPLKKNWLESRCTLTEGFEQSLEDVLNFNVRPDDVFIVTFIKCGTTWMQEAVWLLLNNLDFETSQREPLMGRTGFLEQNGLVPTAPNSMKLCDALPSPRVLKSHMPPNLLPRQVWQKKSKIIYVARNCKDVVVSAYHFCKDLGVWRVDDVNVFVQDFLNNEIIYTNFWSHIVDYWKMRHEPNIFFVTFEEMRSNLAGVIMRLCDFLDIPPLNGEEMKNILDHLSFDKMKENKQTNLTELLKSHLPESRDCFEFMRRGIVGSYRDELSTELQQTIDNWSQEFLSQHGLTEEDIFGKF